MTKNDLPKLGKWSDDDIGPKSKPWVGFVIVVVGSALGWALLYGAYRLIKHYALFTVALTFSGCTVLTDNQATTNSRAAVDEAIATGLPTLKNMAAKQGEDAVRELLAMMERAQQFLPVKIGAAT